AAEARPAAEPVSAGAAAVPPAGQPLDAGGDAARGQPQPPERPRPEPGRTASDRPSVAAGGPGAAGRLGVVEVESRALRRRLRAASGRPGVRHVADGRGGAVPSVDAHLRAGETTS